MNRKLLLSSVSVIPFFMFKKKYYSESDIKKHNTSNDVWVSYKGNVYNISKFVQQHPGGSEKIMKAAGGPLEPYWNIYKQHYNSDVTSILNEYKIGYTDKYNLELNDPYIMEPDRDNNLKVHKTKPFNAEPNLEILRNFYVTPTNYWFVRNHHPDPQINILKYELNLLNETNNININIDDIKEYPKTEIISTIQCAGNRRSEFNIINKTLGLPWGNGAISTAKWGGASLKYILETNNLLNNINGDEYIHLIGSDEPFDCSIPIKKVLDDEVIIAYEMNDDELSLDHGYPIRAIVLGYSGAKNIKWLTGIKISNEESISNWQRGILYKGLSSNIKDINDINMNIINEIPTIEELPVQSFICNIEEYKENNIDMQKIKGIAYSGGGRNIIRVDVSNDNGNNWNTATLTEGKEQKKYKAWAWTFWEITLPNNNNSLLCKATDISYNSQPDNIKNIWNIRGILNNSIYHLDPITDNIIY